MLNVDNITTCYGSIQALNSMSLEVSAGEMVSLLGRNGMGKTTTVRSIMGLTRARSGAITYNGRDIRDLPPYRIARLGVGLVPEDRQIFPTLTVSENLVATAADYRKSGTRWNLQRICDLFPELAARMHHPGSRLSGGEQQMLAIGRALMINPALLILDEATEGLAPKVRSQIWKCLQRLKSSGLSILVIDKHVETLTRICDRHYIIEKGRSVWDGTSEALRAEPSLLHNHLGI